MIAGDADVVGRGGPRQIDLRRRDRRRRQPRGCRRCGSIRPCRRPECRVGADPLVSGRIDGTNAVIVRRVGGKPGQQHAMRSQQVGIQRCRGAVAGGETILDSRSGGLVGRPCDGGRAAGDVRRRASRDRRSRSVEHDGIGHRSRPIASRILELNIDGLGAGAGRERPRLGRREGFRRRERRSGVGEAHLRDAGEGVARRQGERGSAAVGGGRAAIDEHGAGGRCIVDSHDKGCSGRIASRVAGASRNRMRAIRCRRRVPGNAIGRRGVLGAQQIAVQQKLHAGHANVVGGVGRNADRARDDRRGWRREGDGRCGRIGPRSRARQRRYHVRLDLVWRERMIGNADIINAADEFVPRHPRAPPDGDVGCRVLLGGSDRAHQRAVVELSVEIDIQGPRRGIVYAGDVVPGVGLQRRRPEAEHLSTGAVGQLEADRSRPGIDRRVELKADVDPLGDDRGIIARECGGVDPRADGHAARQLQRGGPAEVDIVVDAILVGDSVWE